MTLWLVTKCLICEREILQGPGSLHPCCPHDGGQLICFGEFRRDEAGAAQRLSAAEKGRAN